MSPIDITTIALLLGLMATAVKGSQSVSKAIQDSVKELRSELVQNRTELKQDIIVAVAGLKEEFKSALGDLKTDLSQKDQDLHDAVSQHNIQITNLGFRLHDVEAVLKQVTDGRFESNKKFFGD